MRLLFSSIIATSLLILSACNQSENKQPAVSEEETPTETPSMEMRTYLEMDMDQFDGIEPGDEITISLDSGESYILKIQRVQETIPGLLSIAANVGDKETGQAAMIYRNESLRGNIDLYARKVSYQINYDSDQGRYYLTERTGEDILEGSEPLTPPVNGN